MDQAHSLQDIQEWVGMVLGSPEALFEWPSLFAGE